MQTYITWMKTSRHEQRARLGAGASLAGNLRSAGVYRDGASGLIAPVTLFLADFTVTTLFPRGRLHGSVNGQVGHNGQKASSHHQPFAANLVGERTEHGEKKGPWRGAERRPR